LEIFAGCLILLILQVAVIRKITSTKYKLLMGLIEKLKAVIISAKYKFFKEFL
jgi:hypothetical protein